MLGHHKEGNSQQILTITYGYGHTDYPHKCVLLFGVMQCNVLQSMVIYVLECPDNLLNPHIYVKFELLSKMLLHYVTPNSITH